MKRYGAPNIVRRKNRLAHITEFHATMTTLTSVLNEIKSLQKQAGVKTKSPKHFALTIPDPLDLRGSASEHELLAHIGSKYSHAFAAQYQHFAKMYLQLAQRQLATMRNRLARRATNKPKRRAK